MKKYMIVAAAVFMTAVAKVSSEQFKVPEANTGQAVYSADYGGTKYSTTVFSLAIVTGSFSPCVFQSVFFSSGLATDFVDVYDSTSARDAINGIAPTFRVYNNFNLALTTMGVISPSLGGSSGPKYPIRLNRGLMWKPNSAGYNNISVLYWREE